MIRILISTSIILVLSTILPAQVPDFELKNTENQVVTLGDYKGEKLTVIDFWATWCKPCVNSIPKLIELYNEYHSQGVSFIGISIDSPRNVSKVKPFADALGIPYPVLLDVNSDIMNELDITSIPTLLILDSANSILYLHEGFKAGDEHVIASEIKKFLAINE